jgi:NDP-sugar pyrophosphorylase family protein
MAGGEGRRLLPLTLDLPKPLLRVGEMPILEHVLTNLQHHGVQHVTLAVAHLASTIKAYCGAGIRGLRISYLHEDVPLGTGGAIALLKNYDEPFFMMNGDVLTDINLQAMMAEHIAHKALISVATKVMYTDLTLGVLEVDTMGRVSAYREKPRLEHRFGLGIYVIDPQVRRFMTPHQRIDMPDLITRVIAAGEVVASYDHKGRWTDIGTPSEYAKVDEEWRAMAAMSAPPAASESVP